MLLIPASIRNVKHSREGDSRPNPVELLKIHIVELARIGRERTSVRSSPPGGSRYEDRLADAMDSTSSPPQMTGFRVVNHYSLPDQDIDLNGRRHLILTGPNGSEKTTLLAALGKELSLYLQGHAERKHASFGVLPMATPSAKT